MIVEIEVHVEGAQARLVEPDDFKGFKVVLRDNLVSLAERVAPVGVARLDEHAWIRVDALRELAGAAATPEWEESLQGMLAYARSKGWVDDDLDAIRAHVERSPSV